MPYTSLMDRRNFLTSAVAALGALAIDPEELLWTPGKTKIFIPPANNFLTMRMITFKCLDTFIKQLRSAVALDLARYSVPLGHGGTRR